MGLVARVQAAERVDGARALDALAARGDGEGGRGRGDGGRARRARGHGPRRGRRALVQQVLERGGAAQHGGAAARGVAQGQAEVAALEALDDAGPVAQLLVVVGGGRRRRRVRGRRRGPRARGAPLQQLPLPLGERAVRHAWRY